jgi:hypothetical protein
MGMAVIAVSVIGFAYLPVGSAAAASECTLSPSDLGALALSPSKLTAEEFFAAPVPQQRTVCKTRRAVEELDAHNGVIDASTSDTILAYSTKYLSPAEYDRISEASDNYLAQIMRAKGIGN